MSEFLWFEKYRPKRIEDCALPKRIKKVLQSYVDNQTIPNLILTGPAGSGKTTSAIAMCNEIGINYLFINSSEERGIDTLRTKIISYASTVSLTGDRKVIILDESDYLTPEAQAGLRGAIEQFSQNCTFILTCNFKSRLIEALHSRTTVIDYTLQKEEKQSMVVSIFNITSNILKTENVPFDKLALSLIIGKFFPDYRRIINELQRFSQYGEISESIVKENISEIRELSVLFKALNEKNFTEMRKWVASNVDNDVTRIYRNIYDSLYTYLKKETIPSAVLIIAKYQYQAAFVADQEVNLVACLTEIMIDCEFENV